MPIVQRHSIMPESRGPLSSRTLQETPPAGPPTRDQQGRQSNRSFRPDVQAMLAPGHLLRWIYIGRLSVAVAIFLAAVRVWTHQDTDTIKLLIASLAFALTTAVTVASFG